jgi:hypothetical protein
MSQEERDSIAKSSLVEALGVITLVGPLGRMFWFGRKFGDFRTNRARAVHFVFSGAVVAALTLKTKAFSEVAQKCPESKFDLSNYECWLATINEHLDLLFRETVEVRVELGDLLPYIYLTLAFACAIVVHLAYLAGKHLAPRGIKQVISVKGKTRSTEPFPDAVSAICYLLGLFAVAVGSNAIVLSWAMGAPPLSMIQMLIFASWAMLLFRSVWILFVCPVIWLADIYAARWWAILVVGAVVVTTAGVLAQPLVPN